MNFLLCGRVGKERNDDWLLLFDVVFTGCGKPAFFTNRQALFEVMRGWQQPQAGVPQTGC